jgi:hypothetical protein
MIQLKRIYRSITTLESKIGNKDAAEEAREDTGQIMLKGRTRTFVKRTWNIKDGSM